MYNICYLLTIIVLMSSCFGGGIDKKGSVLSYRSGIVTTEGGAFQIGTPTSQWVESPFRFKAILFKNQEYPASMSVSSFCRGSFDDAPLKVLSNQAFYDLSHQQELTRATLNIEGREALRVSKKGRLDGAPVVLDVVTLKMNACVFDFVLTSDESSYSNVKGDFNQMIEGFHYLKGPNI